MTGAEQKEAFVAAAAASGVTAITNAHGRILNRHSAALAVADDDELLGSNVYASAAVTGAEQKEAFVAAATAVGSPVVFDSANRLLSRMSNALAVARVERQLLKVDEHAPFAAGQCEDDITTAITTAGYTIQRDATGSVSSSGPFTGSSSMSNAAVEPSVRGRLLHSNGYVRRAVEVADQRQQFVDTATAVGSPVLFNGAGRLSSRGDNATAAAAAGMLPEHNSYASTAERWAKEREGVAAEANLAGYKIVRRSDGSMGGGIGKAAADLGYGGTKGYGGDAAAAHLRSEQRQEARRAEWKQFNLDRGNEDVIDYTEALAVAQTLAVAPRKEFHGHSLDWLLTHDGAAYVGQTELANPKDEAFKFNSERGADEQGIGTGATRIPGHQRPVLTLADDTSSPAGTAGTSRVLTLVEAERRGMRYLVAYSSEWLSNVAAVEKALHTRYHGLPLGTRLWREIGRGDQGYGQEGVGSAVYKLYFTYVLDMPKFLASGVVVNERKSKGGRGVHAGQL